MQRAIHFTVYASSAGSEECRRIQICHSQERANTAVERYLAKHGENARAFYAQGSCYCSSRLKAEEA